MKLYLFNSFILCLLFTTNVNLWEGYHTKIDDELPPISWKECGISVRNCDPKTTFKDPPVSPRVWGGQYASTGEYPWFTSLWIFNQNGRYSETNCGGAIINEWWIITGAHCVLKMKTNTDSQVVVAHMGSLNSFGVKTIDVERVVLHSVYVQKFASELEIYKRMRHLKSELTQKLKRDANKTLIQPLIEEYLIAENKVNNWGNVSYLQWDIALMKSKSRIVPLFNSTHYMINSICLPKSGITNTKNESAVITGMGYTDPYEYDADKLKKGITIIRDTNTCAKIASTLSNPRQYNVKDNICFERLNTQNNSLLNSSLCGGDSGSPLHQYLKCKAVQMGIASRIEEDINRRCGRRAWIIRVSIFTAWIRSIIISNDIIVIKETNTLLIVSVITTAIIALIFCFTLFWITILTLQRPQHL